jgi:hypothetical protein
MSLLAGEAVNFLDARLKGLCLNPIIFYNLYYKCNYFVLFTRWLVTYIKYNVNKILDLIQL